MGLLVILGQPVYLAFNKLNAALGGIILLVLFEMSTNCNGFCNHIAKVLRNSSLKLVLAQDIKNSFACYYFYQGYAVLITKD